MRTFTMTGTAIAAALLAGCTGNSDGDAESDSGPATSRTVQVGEFRKLEIAGAYDVEVRTGSAPSVQVEGSQRDIDRLVVEVKGDVLVIHPKKRTNFNWSDKSKTKIAITVPQLDAAKVAGSGTLSIDRISSPSFESSIAGSSEVSIGQVSGQSFKGSLAGSGELEVGQLAVQTVELSIAGSGDADLAGKAERATYTIAGSGSLDAEKLDSRDVGLTIAGSGSVKARATGAVTGGIMGSGSAKIVGGANCKVQKMALEASNALKAVLTMARDKGASAHLSLLAVLVGIVGHRRRHPPRPEFRHSQLRENRVEGPLSGQAHHRGSRRSFARAKGSSRARPHRP